MSGAAATAAYGPQAFGGVIRIVTRRPPDAGVTFEVSQRAGIAQATATPDVRRATREAALTQPVYLVNLDTLARGASWDACGGDCGAFDALFGRTRSILQTDARAGGRFAATGWTLGATARGDDRMMPGTRESYLAARGSVSHSFSGGHSVRVAQLVARTDDHDPVNGFDIQSLYMRPAWLELRGIPGVFEPDVVRPNAFVSLDSLHATRALWQYHSSAAADVHLWRSGSSALSLEAAGSVNRAIRSDSVEVLLGGPGPFPGAREYTTERLATRESFLSARLLHQTSFRRARVATSLGAARTSETYRYGGGGVELTFATAKDIAMMATQGWVLPGGTTIDLSFRRDAPSDLGISFDAQYAWRAAAAHELWSDSSNALTFLAGAGQIQWSPVAMPWIMPLEWAFAPQTGVEEYDDRHTPETRRDFEAGLDLALAGRRVRVMATGYVATTSDAFLPGGGAAGGSSFVTLGRADLRNTGFELGVHATPVAVRDDVSWTASVLAWRSRTTITDVGDVFPHVSRLELGGRYLGKGAPLFRIGQRNAERTGVNDVGDATPSLSFAQLNDFRWNRLRLGTQVDGRVGGDVVNETWYLRDGLELSPDQPDGGLQRRQEGRNGVPRYVDGGGYVRLREVVLSYALGRPGARPRSLLDGARLELAARNLATWSSLDVSDPAMRPISMPIDVARVSARTLTPAVRTVTLALVFAR
jgi:hypothetical protein